MYTASGLASPEELVERYAPLVKRLAYHLAGRLPPSIMVDDLIQAGMLGLLDAASHYDERQGASFETYATIRIRGAMVDELRRNDWAPKSVHKRSREVAEAIRAVEAETGRDAGDVEVAAYMGLDLDEYHRILLQTSTARLISFDDLGGAEVNAGDLFPDDGAGPFTEVAENRFRERLAEAVDRLPERERMIMSMYYEQGFNLKEIGSVIGVGESRVSQLMSQAHARLRSRLSEWHDR